MRRVFWIAVGAGLTLYVMSKVRGYLEKVGPEAVGHRVVGAVTAARDSALDFADRVRAATAESEAEIRASLGLPEQP